MRQERLIGPRAGAGVGPAFRPLWEDPASRALEPIEQPRLKLGKKVVRVGRAGDRQDVEPERNVPAVLLRSGHVVVGERREHGRRGCLTRWNVDRARVVEAGHSDLQRGVDRILALLPVRLDQQLVLGREVVDGLLQVGLADLHRVAVGGDLERWCPECRAGYSLTLPRCHERPGRHPECRCRVLARQSRCSWS